METATQHPLTPRSHTSLHETGAYLVNTYGAVMKTRDVLAFLNISAQTLYKISQEDLPRSEPRGRAGSMFFAMDVARYLHKIIYNKK